MATIELTKENFESTMGESEILFIDFWADWCGPCKMFGPVFEKASEDHPDIVFGKVDTQTQQELAATFGVRSIPTLAVFREQMLLLLQPGALPAEALADLVKQVKEIDMDEVRAKIAEAEAEAEQDS